MGTIKRRTIEILMTLILFGFINSKAIAFTPLTFDAIDTTQIASTKSVSIINLISNPEKFQNTKIVVKGFLTLEFERNALYFHQEDYNQAINENAIWIELSKNEKDALKSKKINGKYVQIQGIFRSDKRGHMGMYGGCILKITQIIPLPLIYPKERN